MVDELPLPQEDKKESIKDQQPKNIWKILTIILAIILVISYIKPFSGGISEDSAKETALTRINALLQGQAVAEVISVEDKDDLYKLDININGEEIESYITKDGSLLFPTAMDLTEPIPTTEAPPTQELPRTKTPEVKLFVMSQCPYGTIAEAAIKPVVDLFKDKINYKLFFIANKNPDGTFTSLHGQPEIDGNIRQLCVEKHYPKVYLDYIECVNKDYRTLPWESCADEMSLNKDTILDCWKGEEGQGLLSENIKEANSLGIGGSPTIIVNGVMYQGARTSEALKKGICEAFNKEQPECEETLETQSDTPDGSC